MSLKTQNLPFNSQIKLSEESELILDYLFKAVDWDNYYQKAKRRKNDEFWYHVSLAKISECIDTNYFLFHRALLELMHCRVELPIERRIDGKVFTGKHHTALIWGFSLPKNNQSDLTYVDIEFPTKLIELCASDRQ